MLDVSPTAKYEAGISTAAEMTVLPVIIVTKEFITDRKLGTITYIYPQRYPIDVKSAVFRTQLVASRLSGHTEV